MPYYMNQDGLLLIGAGTMACSYAQVLKALQVPFTVVGRGEESAQCFQEKTGIKPETGGIDQYLSSHANRIPEKAIIAVRVEEHMQCALSLLKYGVKSILIEKSAGFSIKETKTIADMARLHQAKVVVAYNRRFYRSVLSAEEMIAEDGGVSSFTFEFTELHFDPKRWKSDLPGWFIGNATHVIDLAFYLGGEPVQLYGLERNTCGKAKEYVSFAGVGQTRAGALFSYHADWLSPGRWGVEILTPKRRLILRPLEKLQIQRIGSFQIEEYPLADELDRNFKPGLYLEVDRFLHNISDSHFLSIEDQVRHMEIYFKMKDGYTGSC